MILWKGFRNLNFEQLITLFKLFLKHPLFLWPSIKATADTLRICNDKFGSRQEGHTPENAFRHALWNYLLCLEGEKVSGHVEEAMNWAKTLTELHEKFAPNKELPRKMDLHNNNIGRELFRKERKEVASILPVLEGMMKNAMQIADSSELKDFKDLMVYIEK